MATNEEIKKSIDLYEKENKKLEENSEIYKANQIAIAALNKELEKSVEYLEEQIKNLKQQQQFVNAISDEQGRIIEKERVKLDLHQAMREARRKELLDNAKGRQLTEDELTTLIKIEKKLEKINEQKKDLARAEGAGQTLSNLLGISEGNKNSLTYQMFKNPKQVMDGFKGSLEDAGGFLKGGALSILMKIQEATLIAFQQNDAAISSFVAATGASSKYNDIINATARGNTALGISFAESGKAVTALYENLNTFTTLSTSAQASLTVTAAKLEKLGISGGETAKSIQTLSMVMGVSEVQAAQTVEKFAAMGQAMGISSKQMISDFTAVKEQLAVFGKTIDETFIKLEAQSKATGVAINDLLSLTNKFDTFEGAANQVAKLNAVLGGSYISAMSMIETTDPTERINMIRDAVNDAGMSFESMSYYEKKAVAEAGGFKSVEEAQRILSMSAGEAAEELQRQQASQQQLNDAIERAQPIQEKLTMIMANFAVVMGPVVEIVSSFLSVLVEAMDNEIISGIVKALVIVGATLLAFGTGPIALIAAAILGIASAFFSLHDALLVPHSPILFDVLQSLSGVFESIGNAAKNIGDSIANVAQSFASLHDSIAANPTALFTMAAGLLAVGAAMNDIEADKVINMKVMMEKIVEVSQPKTVEGFEKFSDKFNAVAEATAKIEVAKTNTFTQMLTATQNLSQSLNLNQTVVVRIGSDKFKGVIEKIIDNKMPDNSTSAV
jgi:hypothetical protein